MGPVNTGPQYAMTSANVGAPSLGSGVMYDHGYATSPGFVDKWMSSFTRWAGRVFVGDAGQAVIDSAGQQGLLPTQLTSLSAKGKSSSSSIPNAAKVKGAVSLNQFLGWDARDISFDDAVKATQNPANYKQYLDSRFKAARVTLADVGGPGKAFKNLATSDLKGLVNAAEQKKWLPFGSTLLGIGWTGFNIGKETWDGYQQALKDEQENGGNRANTIGTTALTGLKATAKGIASWHAGTFGLNAAKIYIQPVLVKALGAGKLGRVATTLFSIMAGAGASVATKTGMDSLDRLVFGKRDSDDTVK